MYEVKEKVRQFDKMKKCKSNNINLWNAHNNAIIKYKDKGGVIMPQIRPITDLRNTNEISEICHAKKEPVFITKNGYGDLVVMSIEAYEQMMEDMEIDSAIAEAEEEIRNGGELLDAKETLATLRRKYFG